MDNNINKNSSSLGESVIASKKSLVKRLSNVALVFLCAMALLYFSAEQLIYARIRSKLRSVYNDDNYAVLRLHIGGERHNNPRLWRMLYWVYRYNFTGDYEPMGSAGITGKQHYMTFLVSDNDIIRSAHWSFRQFRLVFDEYTFRSAIIDNVRNSIRHLYRYEKNERERRNGIWFCGEKFNHSEIRFYFR